eukprot:UN04700
MGFHGHHHRHHGHHGHRHHRGGFFRKMFEGMMMMPNDLPLSASYSSSSSDDEVSRDSIESPKMRCHG